MSEKASYRAFRKHVLQPGDRIDRIENLIGLGFPDTNCCFARKEFWIEFKQPTEPKRPSTPLFGSNHPLTVEQRNWFLRQRRAGGHAFIFIDTNCRRILIAGKFADQINTMTVQELLDVALWIAAKPTPAAHWNGLRECLINRT